jgi:hypothetical protein
MFQSRLIIHKASNYQDNFQSFTLCSSYCILLFVKCISYMYQHFLRTSRQLNSFEVSNLLISHNKNNYFARFSTTLHFFLFSIERVHPTNIENFLVPKNLHNLYCDAENFYFNSGILNNLLC